MAKKNDDTYVVEEVKTSKFKGLAKSRPAKITAIALGSAVALGAAFTSGVVLGKVAGFDDRGPGFAEKFDRDGDHKFPGPDGQRPPRPDHAPDGDHDGFAPEGVPNAPQTTSPDTTP